MVARLQYLRFCLFEMYVVFVIGCLYSTMSLTMVKEQRFIRIIYYYYYHYYYFLLLLLLSLCFLFIFSRLLLLGG